jgi:hypothetical protein
MSLTSGHRHRSTGEIDTAWVRTIPLRAASGNYGAASRAHHSGSAGRRLTLAREPTSLPSSDHGRPGEALHHAHPNGLTEAADRAARGHRSARPAAMLRQPKAGRIFPGGMGNKDRTAGLAGARPNDTVPDGLI